MNPKGSTLFIFRHYATFSKFFFKKIFKFYFVPSRETVIFQSYRAWKAHFGCLKSVFKAFHEYVLSIFRKLCTSWALDIAPTLDVPVLLTFTSTKQIPVKNKMVIWVETKSNWIALQASSKSNCNNQSFQFPFNPNWTRQFPDPSKNLVFKL